MLMRLVMILMLLLSAVPVFGQEAETVPVQEYDGLSTLWVLMAAFLVFLMQAGFGMVEAGFIRSKNAANVLMKNVLDFCFAALGFFIFGYAIMYGGDGPLMGFRGWALAGMESPVEGLPLEAFWLFQAVFAGTVATIVSGAVAERMRFVSYLVYSFLISAFIYPVVGHWVWGGGWLANLGFHDFAGSTVVHAVGGFTALIGAAMIGPRIGRFNPDGSGNPISGHSLPLAMLGVFILWFGWYGFNAGSTLGMDDPWTVAHIALTTTLAASTGSIAAMALAWIKYGKPDLTLALNGALGGLVSITAPCAVVGTWEAIVIGLFGGIFVILGIELLNRIRVDDPVGAFPVHGICGIWGTLAVGIFGKAALGAPQDGLLFGGGFSQLGIQALGLVACLGFIAVAMGIVFKLIDLTIKLRVSEETELRGLDGDEHGLESYSGFQIFTTD
jgi:Amt family ammonium transporter